MHSKSLNQRVAIYKSQLDQGDVQVAYTELVKFVTRLKTHSSKKMGEAYTVGNIFQGYMDYTYFYFSSEWYRQRKLKLGLVLNHEAMRFELWLLGQTKPVQAKYWQMLQDTDWVSDAAMPQYSVFEAVLVERPNFDDLDALRDTLIEKLLAFSESIADSISSLEGKQD